MPNALDVKIGNVRISLEADPGSAQDKSLRQNGIWERHITYWMVHFLRQMHSATVLDVGANIGYYSVLASKLGAARVVAFEPNPAVRAVLARNVERNGCAAVVVEESIVGAAGAAMRLTVPDAGAEMAHAVSVAPGTGAPSTTIDAYCTETDTRPACIKIDAEGRDLDVLSGALSTLKRWRPAVVFEFQGCRIESLSVTKPSGIFPALREIGYAPYLFKGHTGVALNAVTFDILSSLYEAAVTSRDAAYWDVLLWPTAAVSLVKPYEGP